MIDDHGGTCNFTLDRITSLTVPTAHAAPPESEPRARFRDHFLHQDGLFYDIAAPIIRRRREKLLHEAEGWMNQELHLVRGELVQVRPLNEIKLTLDENGAFRGLSFMTEMERFCGRRFRVHKQVQKIMLETTGELRRMSVPTIILEGASCDGSAHQGCDRDCPCFWREQWLKRV